MTKAFTIALILLAAACALVSAELTWTMKADAPTMPILHGSRFNLLLKASETITEETALSIKLSEPGSVSHFTIVGAGGMPFCTITDPVSKDAIKIAHVALLDDSLNISFITKIDSEVEISCPLLLSGSNDFDKYPLKINFTIEGPTPVETDVSCNNIAPGQLTILSMSNDTNPHLLDFTIQLPDSLNANRVYKVSFLYRFLQHELPIEHLGALISYADYKPVLGQDVRLIAEPQTGDLFLWTGPNPITQGVTFKLHIQHLNPNLYSVPSSAAGSFAFALAYLGPGKVEAKQFSIGKVAELKPSAHAFLYSSKVDYVVEFQASEDAPTITLGWDHFSVDIVFPTNPTLPSLRYTIDGTDYDIDTSSKPTSITLSKAKRGDIIQVNGYFQIPEDQLRQSTFKVDFADKTTVSTQIRIETKFKFVQDSLKWNQSTEGVETLSYKFSIAASNEFKALPDPIDFEQHIFLEYPFEVRKWGVYEPTCTTKHPGEFKFDPLAVPSTKNLDIITYTLFATLSGALLNGEDSVTFDCTHQLYRGAKPRKDFTLKMLSEAISASFDWELPELVEYNQVVKVTGPPVTDAASLKSFLNDVVGTLQTLPQFSTLTPEGLHYATNQDTPLYNAHHSQGIFTDFALDNVGLYSTLGASLRFAFNTDEGQDPIHKMYIFGDKYEFELYTDENSRSYTTTPIFLDMYNEETFKATSLVPQALGISCISNAQCHGGSILSKICSKNVCKQGSEIFLSEVPIPPDDDADKDSAAEVFTTLAIALAIIALFC